jgi:hypothetical protein
MEEQLMHFPPMTSENLARETLNLPGGFEGDYNLCLIAFQQWHQRLIDTWIPWARELEQTLPGFRYYEFPVIRRLNPLYRGFIDRGMRAGIPDPIARHKTITLYTDKAAFKQALEIDSERDIHLRLVDREGVVHWHATGGLTPETADSLTETLEALLA